MDPIIGEIRLFSGNQFIPAGWALCSGQLLSINEYQALYSLIGTTYGGDGVINFALPNLSGRTPVNVGKGNGLNNTYAITQTAGVENVQLNTNQIPTHNHLVMGSNQNANNVSPQNNFIAKPIDTTQGSKQMAFYLPNNATGMTKAQMDPNSIKNAGNNLPHNNLMPYLTINYIIATVGLYPNFD